MNSFQIEIMENCGDKVRNEFIPDQNEFIPVNFFHSVTVNCAWQKRQWHVCPHCSATCSLQLNWSLVTGDRGHWDKSLWHMQTQYHHNIYTNLAQNFVDTFIKYYLLSIIYTLYAAGAQRDCVKWHGATYINRYSRNEFIPIWNEFIPDLISTIFHNFYLEWIHSGSEWIHSA